MDYLWEDGATFSYNNWFTNRPKDNADQDCMKMKDTGTWDNVVCTKELPYVCQKPSQTCEVAATTTTIASCSACGSWTEQEANASTCIQLLLNGLLLKRHVKGTRRSCIH
eukprot:TRINITY_DN32428_c0_g1_i1.p1 TRINITY_DN32428_c0_g1~~TRINITY_DN32428_c0_g1_i1.p1  ORF type:complete len:110 (+),score=17.02 TRINITY_DN32428_c0_g1_i1:173-502(+)